MHCKQNWMQFASSIRTIPSVPGSNRFGGACAPFADSSAVGRITAGVEFHHPLKQGHYSAVCAHCQCFAAVNFLCSMAGHRACKPGACNAALSFANGSLCYARLRLGVWCVIMKIQLAGIASPDLFVRFPNLPRTGNLTFYFLF